jgi:hypothetical protein
VTTADTIQLSPTYRLVVEYDEGARNVREDMDFITGALTVVSNHAIETPNLHEWPGENAVLLGAEEIFEGKAWEHSWPGRNSIDAARAVTERWARIFYGITLVWMDGGPRNEHAHDWWWVDPAAMRENWPELTVGTPEYVAKEREVIAQDHETYRRWCDGEVYGVRIERLASWIKLDDDGEVSDDGSMKSDWEDAGGDDAIWGCYLDSDYTAIVVAREYLLDDRPNLDLSTIPEK